jgi:hypothetical protein
MVLKINKLLAKVERLNNQITHEKYVDTTELSQSHSPQLINILLDEFNCVCCFNILKRPVTLQCGHSFCQLCLAKWYLAGSASTCPCCRFSWTRVPQVNLRLESSINTLVKYEQARSSSSLSQFYSTSDIESADEKFTLDKFRTKFASENGGRFEAHSNISIRDFIAMRSEFRYICVLPILAASMLVLYAFALVSYKLTFLVLTVLFVLLFFLAPTIDVYLSSRFL